MSNTGDYIAILPVSGLGARRDCPRIPPIRATMAIAAKGDAQPPLDEYFNSRFTALGPQHWWPGKTQFEVILGAVLTQNTSWKNVELALANLRAAGVFTPSTIKKVHIRR